MAALLKTFSTAQSGGVGNQTRCRAAVQIGPSCLLQETEHFTTLLGAGRHHRPDPFQPTLTRLTTALYGSLGPSLLCITSTAKRDR